MDIKRREFLKIAGLSAIAGVGAPTAFKSLLSGEAHASSAAETHGAASSEKPTGKRLGMVIDVRVFKDHAGLAEMCIKACHSVHNVPDFRNPKDEIKWLWVEKYENAFPTDSHYKKNTELHELPFLVACNQCDSPPCVRACPTKATFKDPDGIVMMDFHRCIGCRFCMAACPYGARSFNWRDPRGKDKDGRPFIAKENLEFPTRTRGVVEKCNFCSERLDKGLEPACVEVAKPYRGLIFGDLNDPHSEISTVLNDRFTIQRKPSLGTKPSLFYII